MPRVGISYDEVAATADSIAAEGLKPGIKGIRERLGTGSAGTIQRYLVQWRETHDPVPSAVPDLPTGLLTALREVIDRSKAEERALLEARLVTSQADASELAATVESLEADLQKVVGDLKESCSERDRLGAKVEDQVTEVHLLTRELDRERFSTEQARLEAAQARMKLEAQAEKLDDLSMATEELRSEVASESQGRIDAEKAMAVIVARHEAELEKSKQLFQEKELLSQQIVTERQGAEALRIQVATLTNRLELQETALLAKEQDLKELQEVYELEKSSRFSAEKQAAVMEERLRPEQSQTPSEGTTGSAG